MFHPAEYHVYTWFLFKAEEKNVYRDTHQSTLKKLLGEAGNKVDSVNDFIFCNDSEQNTVVRTNLGQLDGLQAFILNNNAYGIPLNSISCLDFREYVIDSEVRFLL